MNRTKIQTHAYALATALIGLTGTNATAADGDVSKEISLGEEVTIRPSLEYRPRVIAHGGRDFVPGGSSATVTQRLRVGLDARFFDSLGVHVDVQDVRTWGEELSTIGDVRPAGPAIYQAYGQVSLFPGNTIRVGRQEIVADKGRLLFHRNWNDWAQSFDAVMMQQKIDALSMRAFWSRISEDDVYETDADGSTVRGAKADHDLFGVHARSEHLEALRPSVLFLFDRDRSADLSMFALGTYVDGKPVSDLEYRLEAYYQFGRHMNDVTGEQAPMSAWIVSARADYRVTSFADLTMGGYVDYLSGDDPETAASETASIMYGARHALMGIMDMFRNIEKDTGQGGLVDIALTASSKPIGGLKLSAVVHHFVAPRPVQSERVFGQEVDVLGSYAVTRFLDVAFGGGVFVPDDAMMCVRATCDTPKSTELFSYVMAMAHY